ncbi:MAG: hypothetical protein U1E05_26410 [Patescibacteria group bacterium]|nr:hypothetical protein [Patescibacteria group bacterium]
MSQTAMDIERVVREVLAEMAAAPTGLAQTGAAQAPAPVATPAPVAAPTVSPKAQSSAVATAKPSADTLVLTDRLVTLAQLVGRTPATRRVLVPEGAVVTPAVRDELRRRGMTLEFGGAVLQSPADGCRLAVWNVSKRYDAAPLVTTLRREGVAVQLESATCLIATTDALAAVVRGGNTVGLILTRQPAVAQCLANRHAGMRAAIGLDGPQSAADLTALGGNVLVVDWAARTLFPIKQMVSELCRGAPRGCPEELKRRLA